MRLTEVPLRTHWLELHDINLPGCAYPVLNTRGYPSTQEYASEWHRCDHHPTDDLLDSPHLTRRRLHSSVETLVDSQNVVPWL